MKFWEKKPEEKYSIREFQKLVGSDELVGQVEKLETRVKQLECSHDYRFAHYEWPPMSMRVFHKCILCGKKTLKDWDRIAKKGQQALKLLNLVPHDWAIKGKKGDKT